MTWSYDATDLPSAATSGLTNATGEQQKNFVRFLIGDMTSTRELTQDEVIFASLVTEPNVYFAAARLLLAIVQDVLAGGIEDQKVGETRIRIKRSDELVLLAKDLRARGASHMLPSAGGIYLSDREALQENDSILQPAITRGATDIKTTTNQAGGSTDVGGTEDNS